MKLFTLMAASLLVTASATAQRHKLTINAETPEGQMLQQIGMEQDAAKKVALLEEFAAKHPNHEAIGWVYSQLIPAYANAKEFDKVIAIGEKQLAADGEDIEAALAVLKAAEAKRDGDLVLKYAPLTSDLARKIAGEKKPDDEDEVETWKRKVSYATQVDTYSEYALSATALALQTTDPAKAIALVEMLESRNPKSQYLAHSYQAYFTALRQAKQLDKAVAVAEKVLQTDQTNEDMLLFAADYYMQKNQNPDKVLAYSARIIEVLPKKAKPEGVSDADWQNKKNLTLGLAHWMTGVTYANQNKFSQADSSLRTALPLIQGNEQLKAGTLFYLGIANYKLGEAGKGDSKRILDALKFNQECAAIKSPYQAQAKKNIAAIRSQYRIQ